MSGWTKSANPRWNFTPSPNKPKYDESDRITDRSNPVWSSPTGDIPSGPNHIPCGYWWRGIEVTPTLNNPIETYIEMYNIAFWQVAETYPDYKYPKEFEITIDTNDYDGDVSYWFEVIGNNIGTRVGETFVSVNEPYNVYLSDTSGNIYATITLPPEEPVAGDDGVMKRHRVQFTPPSGLTTFTLKEYGTLGRWDDSEHYNNPTLAAVRLIIKQSAEATKTVIQIPMQCLGDWGAIYDYYYHIPLDFYTYSEGYSSGGAHAGHWCTTYESLVGDNWQWDWYAYSNLWKYDSSELSNISKIVFEATAGSPPRLSTGLGSETFWYWIEGGSPTIEWYIALFDDTDTLIDGSLFTGHGDTYEDFLVELPLGTGTYYPKYSFDGITWYIYATSWNVTTTPYRDIIWSAVGNPWYVDPYSGGTGLRFQFSWVYLNAESLDSIYIAIFDETISTMVSGSELVWGPNSAVSTKKITIDKENFISGHEYGIRFKVPDDGGIGCELGFKSNLYLWIDKIENLTVWKRVAKGEYCDYMGRIEPPWTADESRVLLEIYPGQIAYFENTAFSWGNCPSDPDFPCYYSLLDMGNTDYGIDGDEVLGSDVFYGDVTEVEKRYRMRSGEITLINGNQYTTNEPNDESELFQVQAFIVIKER